LAEQFEGDADQLLPPLLDSHSAANPGTHANTLPIGSGRERTGPAMGVQGLA
jgi:hypothetical protein